MWCLTGLENGKQVVKRNGIVGHKSLSTKRLVVESLSDIETSNFKALLTSYFLIYFKSNHFLSSRHCDIKSSLYKIHNAHLSLFRIDVFNSMAVLWTLLSIFRLPTTGCKISISSC